MKKNLLMFSTLFIVFLNTFIYSEEQDNSDRIKVGLFGHYNLNYHIADFQKLGEIPNCCPLFEDGFGNGFTLGGLFELPINKEIFFGSRLFYSILDGKLEHVEKNTNTTIIFIGQEEPTQAEILHTIDSKLSTFGIEGFVGYKIFQEFHLMAGFRFAYLLSNTFNQKEFLQSPKEAVFSENSKKERNVFSDIEIPDKSSILMDLELGMGYNLPLNSSKSLLLTPEIFYSYGLNNLSSSAKWSVNSLRIGLAIKYSLEPSKPVIYKYKHTIDTVKVEIYSDVEEFVSPGVGKVVVNTIEKGAEVEVTEDLVRTDTLFVKKIIPIEVDIKAFGVDNNKEEPLAKLVIEEFFSINMRPLLNYVFFDFQSAILPERYIKLTSEETNKFFVDSLFGISTLPTYYQILNIIGRRMIQNPDAKITIVGCNSDKSDGIISQNELAKMRAEVIFNYLNSIWKIIPERMKIETRNIPDKPSNTYKMDGIIENRRAEIYSDTWEIIEPVITFDTLRVSSPPILRFYPTIKTKEDIKDFIISTKQNNRILKTFSGIGNPPEKFDWRLLREQELIPKFDEPLEYMIKAEDEYGQKDASEWKKLPLEQIRLTQKMTNREGDKEIDRFSLILFDFDTPKLNEYNQRIVDLIKSYIKPNSTVTFEGFTDRMGEDESNLKLSEGRANSAMNAINFANSQSKGFGESDLLFDNDLPEGRFYCRTVNVTVETPIKLK